VRVPLEFQAGRKRFYTMSPLDELRLDVKAFLDEWGSKPGIERRDFEHRFKTLMNRVLRECEEHRVWGSMSKIQEAIHRAIQ
jgi:hypothetical protein